MRVPHPIPYQGSKRRLAPVILQCFPDGLQTLVEPFAGSAAVSIAAAYTGAARQFLINDNNKPLIALWRGIVAEPEEIASGYERLWVAQQGRERAFYDRIRDEFNKTHDPVCFLYLLARCVKASVRYNSNGGFNQSPDNRRKGAKPNTMRRHILRASGLLRGKAQFSDKDYREVLASAHPSELLYMDPPYQGVSTERDPRYANGVGFDEFGDALHAANARQLSYIISYDGRTGEKRFGSFLPSTLNLHRIEIDAGPSSQATLLGRTATTFESLYLSPALVQCLGINTTRGSTARVCLSEAIWAEKTTQRTLFGA